MSGPTRFEDMDPESRASFCSEIMARLSELVEDEAPEEFCSRIAAMLGDCQPLRAFQRTLASTIKLANEVGQKDPDEALGAGVRFGDCVDKVRARLRDQRHRAGSPAGDEGIE
jgi:hypothetical protein